MTFILRSLCQDSSRVCHHLSRPGHLYTRGAEFGVMLILVSGASVSTSQLVINNICCYDSTHVETAASGSWARQLEADSLLLSSSNISIPISQSLPTDRRAAIQRKSAKRKWRNSFVRVGKVLVLNFPFLAEAWWWEAGCGYCMAEHTYILTLTPATTFITSLPPIIGSATASTAL